MDIQIKKLSTAEAAALREEYRRSQEKAVGVMQVFASEQDQQSHLQYVAKFQAQGGQF